MRTTLLWLSAAAIGLGLVTVTDAQQPTTERLTVPFSDPSRPGRVHVELLNGSITVKGTNRADVAIEVRGGGDERRSRPDATPSGLRRLTQNAGFTVSEENNQLEIEGSFMNRQQEFDLQVPMRTSLKLSTVNNGTIVVDSIEGDLEIDNVNGPITMTNIAGSVVANTVNGKVLATLTRVTAQKAMAFTSLNGAVDVTLPSNVKATLKLRSDHGDVFTDFDIQMKPASAPTVEDTRRAGRGRYRIEVNNSIYGTINGGGPEFELRSFNGSVYVRKGA